MSESEYHTQGAVFFFMSLKDAASNSTTVLPADYPGADSVTADKSGAWVPVLGPKVSPTRVSHAPALLPWPTALRVDD